MTQPLIPTKMFAKGFHPDLDGIEVIYIPDSNSFVEVKGKWLYGSQLCIGNKIYILPVDFKPEDIDIADFLNGDFLSDYVIMNVTLCRATDFWSFDEINPTSMKLHVSDRDLITLRRRDKVEYQFLIWYMEEGSTFIAVPWKKETSNDQAFLGYPVNYADSWEWDNFILAANNVYGDFDSLKIEGNIYSCPEILGWVS